jgi:hypothetical protein
MNYSRIIGPAILVAVSLSYTRAQTPPPPDATVVTVPGFTQKCAMTVTLGYSTILSFAPFAPPPPINLPPGSALKLTIEYHESDFVSVHWMKDDKPLGITTADFEIPNVTESDSGYYSAVIKRTSGEIASDVATIRVGPGPRQKLVNLSTRATIGPANQTVICGFVVPRSPGTLRESKWLLIRAIGPALAAFKVAHPLASPALQIFRSDGTMIDLPISIFVPSIPSIAMKIGAFPVPTDSADISVLINLPAGVYSARVSSGDGGGGDVLLEVYEVPDEALDFYSGIQT